MDDLLNQISYFSLNFILKLFLLFLDINLLINISFSLYCDIVHLHKQLLLIIFYKKKKNLISFYNLVFKLDYLKSSLKYLIIKINENHQTCNYKN